MKSICLNKTIKHAMGWSIPLFVGLLCLWHSLTKPIDFNLGSFPALDPPASTGSHAALVRLNRELTAHPYSKRITVRYSAPVIGCPPPFPTPRFPMGQWRWEYTPQTTTLIKHLSNASGSQCETVSPQAISTVVGLPIGTMESLKDFCGCEKK